MFSRRRSAGRLNIGLGLLVIRHRSAKRALRKVIALVYAAFCANTSRKSVYTALPLSTSRIGLYVTSLVVVDLSQSLTTKLKRCFQVLCTILWQLYHRVFNWHWLVITVCEYTHAVMLNQAKTSWPRPRQKLIMKKYQIMINNIWFKIIAGKI